MGLSEINSKNYEMILDKVKYTDLTSVVDSPGLQCSVNANNIKNEIKQQQKYLSECKLRLNRIPVPPRRNGYSIFIGTKSLIPVIQFLSY